MYDRCSAAANSDRPWFIAAAWTAILGRQNTLVAHQIPQTSGQVSIHLGPIFPRRCKHALTASTVGTSVKFSNFVDPVAEIASTRLIFGVLHCSRAG